MSVGASLCLGFIGFVAVCGVIATIEERQMDARRRRLEREDLADQQRLVNRMEADGRPVCYSPDASTLDWDAIARDWLEAVDEMEAADGAPPEAIERARFEAHNLGVIATLEQWRALPCAPDRDPGLDPAACRRQWLEITDLPTVEPIRSLS